MGFYNPMVLASHYRLEECAGLNGIQLQFVGGGGGGMKLNDRILKGLREESDLVMPPIFSQSPTSVSQFLPVSCDSSSPTSVCQIPHENCDPYYNSKSLPSTSTSQLRHENCDPYCISRSPQSTCTSEVLPRMFNPCYISNCKAADEVCPEVHKEEEEGCNAENSAMYGETLFTELFGQTGANNIGLESYDKVKEESEPLVPMGSLQYQLATPQQQQEQYSVLGAINPGFSLFGAPIVSQGFTENQQIGDPVISMAMAMPDSFSLQDTKSACWSGQIVDRSIEKKKNRMIKNRESAARSRARKQAHIKQLEDEVVDLRIRREELMKRKDVKHRRIMVSVCRDYFLSTNQSSEAIHALLFLFDAHELHPDLLCIDTIERGHISSFSLYNFILYGVEHETFLQKRFASKHGIAYCALRRRGGKHMYYAVKDNARLLNYKGIVNKIRNGFRRTTKETGGRALPDSTRSGNLIEFQIIS